MQSVSGPAPATSSAAETAPGEPGEPGGGQPQKGALRRGKWTTEEESYVKQIIDDFNCGTLSVAAGTTLRSYLSEKLNCDPMRITKKFTGESCIGKRVFHPVELTASNEVMVRQAQKTLERLEADWQTKLQEQRLETERKNKKACRSGGPFDDDPCGLLRAGGLCLNETDSEFALSNGEEVDPATVRWLRQAQAALKRDAQLCEVDQLLAEGESVRVQCQNSTSGSSSNNSSSGGGGGSGSQSGRRAGTPHSDGSSSSSSNNSSGAGKSTEAGGPWPEWSRGRQRDAEPQVGHRRRRSHGHDESISDSSSDSGGSLFHLAATAAAPRLPESRRPKHRPWVGSAKRARSVAQEDADAGGLLVGFLQSIHAREIGVSRVSR